MWSMSVGIAWVWVRPNTHGGGFLAAVYLGLFLRKWAPTT